MGKTMDCGAAGDCHAVRHDSDCLGIANTAGYHVGYINGAVAGSSIGNGSGVSAGNHGGDRAGDYGRNHPGDHRGLFGS